MKWAIKRQKDQTITVAFGNLTAQQAYNLLELAATHANQKETDR
jgi:hypothetical protein